MAINMNLNLFLYLIYNNQSCNNNSIYSNNCLLSLRKICFIFVVNPDSLIFLQKEYAKTNEISILYKNRNNFENIKPKEDYFNLCGKSIGVNLYYNYIIDKVINNDKCSTNFNGFKDNLEKETTSIINTLNKNNFNLVINWSILGNEISYFKNNISKKFFKNFKLFILKYYKNKKIIPKIKSKNFEENSLLNYLKFKKIFGISIKLFTNKKNPDKFNYFPDENIIETTFKSNLNTILELYSKVYNKFRLEVYNYYFEENTSKIKILLKNDGLYIKNNLYLRLCYWNELPIEAFFVKLSKKIINFNTLKIKNEMYFCYKLDKVINNIELNLNNKVLEKLYKNEYKIILIDGKDMIINSVVIQKCKFKKIKNINKSKYYIKSIIVIFLLILILFIYNRLKNPNKLKLLNKIKDKKILNVN